MARKVYEFKLKGSWHFVFVQFGLVALCVYGFISTLPSTIIYIERNGFDLIIAKSLVALIMYSILPFPLLKASFALAKNYFRFGTLSITLDSDTITLPQDHEEITYLQQDITVNTEYEESYLTSLAFVVKDQKILNINAVGILNKQMLGQLEADLKERGFRFTAV